MYEIDQYLLRKLKSDCDHYLRQGSGNGNKEQLYSGSVSEHVNGMIKVHSELPDECKPEWLTMEQILEYKKDMLASEAAFKPTICTMII